MTARRGSGPPTSITIHGLSISVGRVDRLVPDDSRAYQTLSGRGVKNMDLWLIAGESLRLVEVTSKGTVKRLLAEDEGGLERLTAELTAKAVHTLLLLAAGLAGIQPAAGVLDEHPHEIAWAPVKLVFLVAAAENRPDTMMFLKDDLVRRLHGHLAIVGASKDDVIVTSPHAAEARRLFI